MRLLSFIALAGLIALSGCKQPKGGTNDTNVSGTSDVAVKQCNAYPASDNQADASTVYEICTIVFTNHVGNALAPRIDKFIFEDGLHHRYHGQDQGAAELIGISNFEGVLKDGESHAYTIGFKIPANTIGVVYYDPT
jgi:hypothetical protein